MSVEAVGFAYAPAHLHSVYGMADFFLGNRDEELWARGGLAVGIIRGREIIRAVRVIRGLRGKGIIRAIRVIRGLKGEGIIRAIRELGGLEGGGWEGCGLGGWRLSESCKAGGVDGPHGPQGVGHDRMRSGIAAVKELAYSNLAA